MFGLFGNSKSPIEQPAKEAESEGMRILFDFKLTGETVAKIAIAVISTTAAGLFTAVLIQAMRSPVPTPIENTQPLKK